MRALVFFFVICAGVFVFVRFESVCAVVVCAYLVVVFVCVCVFMFVLVSYVVLVLFYV